VLRNGSYATITGKAFRPRPLRLGARAWPMVTVCWAYLTFAVFLPMAALLMTSFQKFATVIVGDMRFTLDNYASVFRQGALASALTNSIVLGLGVATVGSLLVGVLVWVIFRARVPGRFLVEYVVMFPQAVPRLVFGLGLLWAWLWIGQVLPPTLAPLFAPAWPT
jgi:iron(III) transport system permease protein